MGAARWGRVVGAAGLGLVVGAAATGWLLRSRAPGAPAGAAKAPAPVTAVAQAAPYRPRYLAYAQVGPVHDVTVASRVLGTVSEVDAQIGDRVAAGAPLARVGGPLHRAALQRTRAAVAGDRSSLARDQALAAATGHLLSSGLATLTRREAAKAAVARARSRLAADQATLAALEAGGTLRAPVAGTVVAVAVAAGSPVSVGAPAFTLEPAGRLQLLGRYYGAAAAALVPGTPGTFHPADGSAPVAVVLRRVVPPVRPDGAVIVTCRPAGTAPGPGWRSGEAGRLALEGPPAPAVLVPTTALVLDQGRFYVVVHDAQGDHPRPVRPGPSRGFDTVILGGLKAGTAVVSRDADLRYHQGLARTYAPPD